MSTGICCAACRRADTTTTEDLNWCAECSELICKQCASLHIRFKTTCQHKITAVTNEKAMEILSSVVDRNCKDHPEEVITYLCRDHDTLCCNTCVITKHGQCKDRESTDNIGKRLKDGKITAEPSHWIQGLERKCSFLEGGFCLAKKELAHSERAILDVIKGTRDQINVALDKLEQSILDDFHSKAKKIESQVALDTEVLHKTEAEAKQLSTILNINKELATNTQYLLAARLVERKRNDLEACVNELLCHCRITKFEMSLDPVVSDMRGILTKQNDIIKTNEEPLTTAVQSSTVAIEKGNKPSFAVNVEILEDGRVLVLDQSQAILRLLDSNLNETCQMSIKDAKQFTVVSRTFIVVCLNDCKSVKCFKISGTKIEAKTGIAREVRTGLNCISLSKYNNSAVLICSNEKNGFYSGDVIFKLLKEDRLLVSEFNFPKMDKISPWRGFVFDPSSETFIAISPDGSSLIWLGESGQVIREKQLENIGRGGLSGLAVDKQGRVYTAATRKIFELTGTGDISGIYDASINVYSIAVSTNGDKLIAVGHNEAIEVFTLNRLD